LRLLLSGRVAGRALLGGCSHSNSHDRRQGGQGGQTRNQYHSIIRQPIESKS
jgi:hypothetical protein